MVGRLGDSIFYSDSYFLYNVTVEQISDIYNEDFVGKWDNNDQYQLY